MSEKRRSIEAVDEDVAWDWRDHFFEELVNADISSLDLSQTLWDELSSQNNNDEDLELRSLLSTPDYCIDDIALLAADHSASFFQSSSSSCSQESSVEGDSDAAIFLRGEGGGENPRLKKRRLFNGPQQQTISTAFSSDDDMGEEGDAPPAPVQDTMMLTVPPVLLKTFADNPVKQQDEEEEGYGILSSMPAIWYHASTDDSQSSCLGDSNQQMEPMMMMMSSENWMSICIEDNDTTGVNGFHNHKKKEEVAVVTGIAKQKTPGGLTPLKISNEEVVLQGPLTPFSSRPSTPVNRTNAVKKSKASSTTPVAYPFTLVKPLGGTEGDMTLMDINQLISTTPPRSNNTGTTTTRGSSSSNSSTSSSSSSTSSRDPRPNTKVDYGVGLSGKSIVTRTRICTKGNGTITIMRTKG